MIGRKTALVCAALIALMFAAAVARIVALDDWVTLVLDNRAKLPSLLLFFFPACSALVVGALYRNGIRAGAGMAPIGRAAAELPRGAPGRARAEPQGVTP